MAWLLHSRCCGLQTSESISESVLELFDLARNICMDRVINVLDVSFNKDTVGPGIYLVKLLVREYGLASLTEVSKIFKWIIPECFASTNQVCEFVSLALSLSTCFSKFDLI